MSKIAVLTKVSKNDEVTATKCVVLNSAVGGKYSLRKNRGKLIFKTDEGVKNYLLRKFKSQGYTGFTIVEPGDFPKHKGGGTYILSNGVEVGNKESAHKQEPTLNI